MRLLANIIWFLLGGVVGGILWTMYGILWCCTIIGIPLGRQCFKFASLSFAPFGKDVNLGGGPMSLIANIFWLLVTGIEMASVYAAIGCIFCITIIGIPVGKQFFKFAKLSLLPFGAKVR